MKKIILFSGKAEHGKTTAANMLKKMLEDKGNKVVVTRYAYYLKDLAARYCGWNGEKDNYGRQLLQQLGTDIIRVKLNKPNFHVGRICEDIEICQDYVDYVIIDDTRFTNEVFRSALSDEQLHHISETALDDFEGFDYKISASNLDELEDAIAELSSCI